MRLKAGTGAGVGVGKFRLGITCKFIATTGFSVDGNGASPDKRGPEGPLSAVMAMGLRGP